MAGTLPAIAAELWAGDELIVVDNASSDGTPERVAQLAPAATVISSGGNLGFGAACNIGAETASAPVLLLLNPDAVVQPGFREAIALPLDPDHPGNGWDAWQGLVTDDGGASVNTWGGVVHFTGIAWAGGAGRPISDAPREPREVSFPTGACLAIKRAVWEELGGFSPEYFLYHEDTDLGLRLWLGGYRCGIEPRARVDHDYEFHKGAHKWLYLEQNRYATILRTYPKRVLLAVLPALLLTELALLAAATAGGWLPQKLRAYSGAMRAFPRLREERRRIQADARLAAAPFADLLGVQLDSSFLGAAGRSRPLNRLLAAYWRMARMFAGI